MAFSGRSVLCGSRPHYEKNVFMGNFQSNELQEAFLWMLQSRKEYLTKVKKSSKVVREKKCLIFVFACFLTAIAKV